MIAEHKEMRGLLDGGDEALKVRHRLCMLTLMRRMGFQSGIGTWYPCFSAVLIRHVADNAGGLSRGLL